MGQPCALLPVPSLDDHINNISGIIKATMIQSFGQYAIRELVQYTIIVHCHIASFTSIYPNNAINNQRGSSYVKCYFWIASVAVTPMGLARNRMS